jgi:tetratricopeptide (TPR) repeat protein
VTEIGDPGWTPGGIDHAIALLDAGQVRGAAAMLDDLLKQQLAAHESDHPEALRLRQLQATAVGDQGDFAAARDACEKLIPVLVRVLGADHSATLDSRRQAGVWRALAGDPLTAVLVLHQLLAEELSFGATDDETTFATRSCLAHAVGRAGDVVAARSAHQTLLADRRRVLRGDHPDTLRSLAAVSTWSEHCGDDLASATFAELALQGMTVTFGADHADTMRMESQLVDVRPYSMERSKLADLSRVLQHQVRVLGPDHLLCLDTRSAIARWTSELGDLTGATTQYIALIADQTRILGALHPRTLNMRLANAYRSEDGSALLGELLRDALTVLPDRHPTVLTIRNNIAFASGELGDPEGAIEAFEELLIDRISICGPDHPHTLNARNNIAYFRHKAGDTERAIQIATQVLGDRLRILGSDHPDTITARSNLALMYATIGQLDYAANTTKLVLADRVRIQGPDHADTLFARHNVARLLAHTNDPSSPQFHDELLADESRILGPTHPRTLITRMNVGRIRGYRGDITGAVTLLTDVYRDHVSVLGKDHPQTFTAASTFAYFLGRSGDPEAGLALLDEVLVDALIVLGPGRSEFERVRRTHLWLCSRLDRKAQRARRRRLESPVPSR